MASCKTEKIFCNELKKIRSGNVRTFTCAVSDVLPEYFLEQDRDNKIVRNIKETYRIAWHLFSLSSYSGKFSDIEKDCICSALILCDGFLYGGHESFVDPRHPFEMADYIREEYWNQYLPCETRNVIADLVETHHGSTGAINDIQQFVQSCILLTDTFFYPRWENGQVLLKQGQSTTGIDEDLRCARSIVKNTNWDGVIMNEEENNFIYLDGKELYIPKRLMPAFQILRQLYTEKEAKTD